MLLSDSAVSRRERWFRVATAALFWPLYLPLLLRPSNNSAVTDNSTAQPCNELTAIISQVERELDAALRSLEAGSLQTRLPTPSQLEELQTAWQQQAVQIRELDALLAADSSTAKGVAQLQALRQKMYEDLLATLGSVRDLITRIHLTKFTGTSANRTAELIAQIGTTVEGLSEVTASGVNSLATNEPS